MYQSMRAMCRKHYRDETKFAKIVHVRHDVRTTLKLSTRACLTAVGGRTVGLCEAFGSFERRREKGMMPPASETAKCANEQFEFHLDRWDPFTQSQTEVSFRFLSPQT